ncbi:PQQ-binding-like beta-propeller repeat protein [Coleofasciculus sp. FACHB-501]|uniref:outer membrane protein assembly factor BamB family protein n=1 Tax=Cyanophyceae TaxID=3028117 RepID=UPI0016830FE0|nr:PQQ-binding-like beta-propeller repeat protein [Coleofasciculus sp. FACHB-501]
MLKKLFKYVLVGVVLVLGYHASASAISAASTRQPVWSVNLHASTAPIATENRLLVPTGNTKPSALQSLDPATGKVQWRSQQPIGRVFAIEGNTIYASDFGLLPLVDDPKNLVTLDANTGKTKAVLPLDNSDFAGMIGVSQGAFILNSYVRQGVESDRNEISARTPDKLLWKFVTSKDSMVSTFESVDSKSPVVQNGVVFLPILVNPSTPQRGYQLTGLDAATGKVLWTWNTSAELTDVTVLGDTVYPAVYSKDRTGKEPGWVKALDLKTGKERWTHTMRGGEAKLASDREVFIWDGDAKTSTRFVVLDRQTGAMLRQFTLSRQDRQEPRPIALADNIIYTADMEIEGVSALGFYGSAKNHSRVNAFDATSGQVLWHTPTLRESHIYRFVLNGDRLFLSSNGLENNVQSVVQSFSTR